MDGTGNGARSDLKEVVERALEDFFVSGSGQENEECENHSRDCPQDFEDIVEDEDLSRYIL